MTSSELRKRAGGQEMAKHDQMAEQIRRMEKQFELAMPKGVEATQLIRDALTALRQNPKLAECTPQSVLGGLMTCAQLGLRVGVLDHAWLIPFWDGAEKRFNAQLVIGYKGLAELAYRSDRVGGIIARTVYENDPVFEVDYGTEDTLKHKPTMDGRPGRPIAYYCVVHIKGGRPVFFVMGQKAMEEYRDRHAKARNRQGKIVGPWVDNFEGMAHKTCLRQLSKWLPKSTELHNALVADDGIRLDLAGTPSDATEQTPGYDYEGQVVGEFSEGDPNHNTETGEVQ